MFGRFAFFVFVGCLCCDTEVLATLRINDSLSLHFFSTFAANINKEIRGKAQVQPSIAMGCFMDACKMEGVFVLKEETKREQVQDDEDATAFIQRVLNGQEGPELSRENLKDCVYSTLFLANEKLRFCKENQGYAEEKRLKEEAFSLIKEVQKYKGRAGFKDVMQSKVVAEQVSRLKGYTDSLDQAVGELLT